MKTFLFDIEGTTSDIHFVHQVLFPYSAHRLKEFILAHQTNPDVQQALHQVDITFWEEQNKASSLGEKIDFLLLCIKHDRKYPPLKVIQGLIWEEGYQHQHFRGHVYPDVEPFWKRILQDHGQICIYSSGSVKAQQLIFKYSTSGDLTSYISHYFDTKVGHKRESSSYLKISQALKQAPHDIIFFSDIREELSAALAAGLNVIEIQRTQMSVSPFRVLNDLSFWDSKL